MPLTCLWLILDSLSNNNHLYCLYMETLQILANCQLAQCSQGVVANHADACDHAVCITAIICITVLLLSIVLAILHFQLRKKQFEAKQDDEKKLYRSKLVNILEMKAKGLTMEGRQELSFNDEQCTVYIKELKSLINNLQPTK